jgi:hypothetical protein
VVRAFFPLDEELALLPGHLTPSLQEDLTHLGTWMPFARAAQMLQRLLGVSVSEATARRLTEQQGAAYAALQDEEVARIEQELPPAAQGADKQLLSVDGAMVPLVHGEWAEVKTLVLGVIGEPVIERGEAVVHAEELSYFSRLAEAESFTRLALVETQRRGVETAKQVIAVTDGAEWEQGFIDHHRPDAARVLDFPHASEYVALIGAAIWGADTPTTQQWLKTQLTTLKHEGAEAVLPTLRTLVQSHAQLPDLAGHLAYLEKRAGHMQYPFYLAQGWPIGSGAVESGNKLVVEARLKGAGMHWARAHVNPMLALRNAACGDRWDEAWSHTVAFRRQQRVQQRLARHPCSPPPPTPRPIPHTRTAPPPQPDAPLPTPDPPKPRWRPAPDHPWRRFPAWPKKHRQKPNPHDAKK